MGWNRFETRLQQNLWKIFCVWPLGTQNRRWFLPSWILYWRNACNSRKRVTTHCQIRSFSVSCSELREGKQNLEGSSASIRPWFWLSSTYGKTSWTSWTLGSIWWNIVTAFPFPWFCHCRWHSVVAPTIRIGALLSPCLMSAPGLLTAKYSHMEQLLLCKGTYFTKKFLNLSHCYSQFFIFIS